MPGNTIGNYTVLEQIGESRFSSVFKTNQPNNQHIVRALKLFKFALPRESNELKRFLQIEAASLCELYHGHIVRTFDFGFHYDKFYLVMDYVPGTTLESKLESGPLPVAETVKLSYDLASALAYAHSLGILHRNLISRNVLIRESFGDAVLADFHTAKITSGPLVQPILKTLPPAGETDKIQTAYLSPEARIGDPNTAKSDIYQFGLLLYDCLAGSKAALKPLEPLSSLRNDVPPVLEDLISRCLERDPGKRHASAVSLLNEISALPREDKKSARRVAKVEETQEPEQPQEEPREAPQEQPAPDAITFEPIETEIKVQIDAPPPPPKQQPPAEAAAHDEPPRPRQEFKLELEDAAAILETQSPPPAPKPPAPPPKAAPAKAPQQPLRRLIETAEIKKASPLLLRAMAVIGIAVGVSFAAFLYFKYAKKTDSNAKSTTFDAEIVASSVAVPVQLAAAPVKPEPAPAPAPEPEKPAAPPAVAAPEPAQQSAQPAAPIVETPKPAPEPVADKPAPPPEKKPEPPKRQRKPVQPVPQKPKKPEPARAVFQPPQDMAAVPAGRFRMGNQEKLRYNVDLDAFYIDKYEVSVENYLRCVNAGKCRKPVYSDAAPAACNLDKTGTSKYPVNCVTWTDAQTYCAWLGKRLPTEAEWEKAARSTDARQYPWGDAAPDCDHAVITDDDGNKGCGLDRTSKVGSKHKDISPYGVFDMGGNVSEFVNDWYDAKYYYQGAFKNPPGPSTGFLKVVRGGSWENKGTACDVTNRNMSPVSSWSSSVGFRCAVSAPKD